MSDNNINPDPKDPHREDSPENKPIDNGNPEEISGERNSLSSENPPQDDDLKNPIIEKPVNEETSDEEEFLSG